MNISNIYWTIRAFLRKKFIPKTRAINIITYQKDKIGDKYSSMHEVWLVHTTSLIKEFLGEKSDEYIYLNKFTFEPKYAHTMTESEILKEQTEMIITLKLFLDNCISTIRIKGLTSQKGNFISRMSEGWAIFWVGFLTVSVSSFAYWRGVIDTQNKIDIEKINFKKQLDSLSRIPKPLIIDTNKTTNNNAKKSISNMKNK